MSNTSSSQFPRWKETFPFSRDDWESSSLSVREHLIALDKRVAELEARLNKDSSNSNQPPSSDSPFKKGKSSKPPSAETKSASDGKKGRPGHSQKRMSPTETKDIHPAPCCCGSTDFLGLAPFHTHQVIEFPLVQMDVIHFHLHKGICAACGNTCKATIPTGFQTGFGPRLSALIGEMSGIQGGSRRSIKDFCSSVLGFPISLGAIQKVVDRVSEAIEPHYQTIGQKARTAAVNFIDETTWFLNGVLMWLWVMTNTSVAFYLIHPRRSKEAFAALIEDWAGILVSDGYGVYQKWVDLRQTCLAHLIRKAKSLAMSSDPEISACGRWARDELRRLCRMAKAPPTVGEWRAFYARLSKLIKTYHDRSDEAGKFARRLLREMDSLWVFLEVESVEPTNNRAERAARFGVLWRKRSQGTSSEKGNRWVERILSLRETCRIRGIPSFPILVDAVQAKFQGSKPDLSWI